MTSATAEPPNAAGPNAPRLNAFRLRPKLWLAIALVFAAQVALVFWLGNPPVAKPPQPAVAPVIHFAGDGSAEMLALLDPTLLVLPHYDNFSAAWLKIPQLSFTPANWTEPTHPLPLKPERLGTAFASFMETNPPPPFQTTIASEADWPDIPSSPVKSLSAPSTPRIEGPLAARRLLTPIHLPPQINTNSEVLPNTEVQVLVNAQGITLSAVVVPAASSEADAVALAFARSARFEPLKAPVLGAAPPDKLTFGRMIFEWQTVPAAATNLQLSP